jgi:hypothetical protein
MPFQSVLTMPFQSVLTMPFQSVRLVSNTMTKANGNTVMMTGETDWLIEGNVFSRNTAPRFFKCGTTDIMIGGLRTTGTISHNEIGWRGEHPGSPDGCAIDYEAGSDGVAVTDNLIHDSYGAGVMVFGLRYTMYYVLYTVETAKLQVPHELTYTTRVSN